MTDPIIDEDWLVTMGVFFKTIELGADLVMNIMELHGFTDSARSSFDVAETHMQISRVSKKGLKFIKMTAKGLGYPDYEKTLNEQIKKLEDEARRLEDEASRT